MHKDTITSHQLTNSRLSTVQWRIVQYFGLLLLIFGVLPLVISDNFATFPENWYLNWRDPIDEFQRWLIRNRSNQFIFVWVFNPFSDGIEASIRAVETFLLNLPWFVVVGAACLIGQQTAGFRLGLVAGGSMILMGVFGLWDATLITLALMGSTIAFIVVVGVPIGILATRFDRLAKTLRPILDAMQTVPIFVYLIPTVLVFGIGRTTAIVTTVIYAIPPIIRMTNLGLREVSANLVEVGQAFGTTSWQMLVKVRIPLALPTLLVGLNQAVMIALSAVIFASLVGAPGLGEVVIRSLRQLDVGLAFEAGLGVVLMAIVIDRTGRGLSYRVITGTKRGHSWVLWGSVITLMALSLFGNLDFPARWQWSISQPVDAAVIWMRDNLYQIGDWPIGTGPLGDVMTIYGLQILDWFLMTWLPWPLFIVGATYVVYLLATVRLAIFTAGSLLWVGLLGMWQPFLITFSQVMVAATLTTIFALPLGILMARSQWFAAILEPTLDFIQTIPYLIYLIPVIMLFNVGPIPGITAAVLYALAPGIRLTSTGIQQIDTTITEASLACGATPWQTLWKIQIPLALPAILLGLNQVLILSLIAVVYGALSGSSGLGLETLIGLSRNQPGTGVEAGLAIVLMTIILDRATQAWPAKLNTAASKKEAL